MAKTIKLNVNELQNKFNRLGLKNKIQVMKDLVGLDKDPKLTLIGHDALLIEPHLAETKPEVAMTVWVPGKIGPTEADWKKSLQQSLEELKLARLHASSEDVIVLTYTDKNGNTHTIIVVKSKIEKQLHK